MNGGDLYEQYAQKVYRFLFAQCGQADLAEELTQETFCRALQKLAPETREVIYLRLAGEFSFGEIGEILGRSEVWARVRFYRGKEELTRLMGGDRG